MTRIVIILCGITMIGAVVFSLPRIVEVKKEEDRAKRNAQNLASVYASAITAGADELSIQTELDVVIEMLEKGVECHSFTECTFRVPNLIAEETEATKRYLRLDFGEYTSLTFLPGGREEG